MCISEWDTVKLLESDSARIEKTTKQMQEYLASKTTPTEKEARLYKMLNDAMDGRKKADQARAKTLKGIEAAIYPADEPSGKFKTVSIKDMSKKIDRQNRKDNAMGDYLILYDYLSELSHSGFFYITNKQSMSDRDEWQSDIVFGALAVLADIVDTVSKKFSIDTEVGGKIKFLSMQ